MFRPEIFFDGIPRRAEEVVQKDESGPYRIQSGCPHKRLVFVGSRTVVLILNNIVKLLDGVIYGTAYND